MNLNVSTGAGAFIYRVNAKGARWKRNINYIEGRMVMKKWVCKVCGYVYEGETPPDECPICGVGPDEFEEVTE